MGKVVSYGAFWQEYGRDSIKLPDDVDGNDKKAVLEYLESIRDDLPLPSGEYVCDSFEIDPESIVLEVE